MNKSNKAFDLYKVLAERNIHLYIKDVVNRLIDKEEKDELIVLVELQYARANIVSAVEAMNHKEYESAYQCYKEAYEDARLVEKYRVAFEREKQGLPEKEICKKATCAIAQLYVQSIVSRSESERLKKDDKYLYK